MHSGEAFPSGVGTELGQTWTGRAFKCGWLAASVHAQWSGLRVAQVCCAWRAEGCLQVRPAATGVGCYSSCSRVGLAWRLQHYEWGLWEVIFRCDWL